MIANFKQMIFHFKPMKYTSIDKDGLVLNIDLDLAKSIGIYFRLTDIEIEQIIEELRL